MRLNPTQSAQRSASQPHLAWGVPRVKKKTVHAIANEVAVCPLAKLFAKICSCGWVQTRLLGRSRGTTCLTIGSVIPVTIHATASGTFSGCSKRMKWLKREKNGPSNAYSERLNRSQGKKRTMSVICTHPNPVEEITKKIGSSQLSCQPRCTSRNSV